MITLDTSAILAALDSRDVNHDRTMALLEKEAGDLILPCTTLSEVGYFIEKSLGAKTLDAFLFDLEMRYLRFDCGIEDFNRTRELASRYADLPLGLVDAAVIACAERNGGRVATFDFRHFGAVAREGTITVLPAN